MVGWSWVGREVESQGALIWYRSASHSVLPGCRTKNHQMFVVENADSGSPSNREWTGNSALPWDPESCAFNRLLSSRLTVNLDSGGWSKDGAVVGYDETGLPAR